MDSFWPVHVLPGTQSHLTEIVAGLCNSQIASCRQLQQFKHRNALKPYRLLKGIAQAKLGPFCNIQIGNILSIP